MNRPKEEVPSDFAATFASGGWRAIDKRYGARTAKLWEWIAASKSAQIAKE